MTKTIDEPGTVPHHLRGVILPSSKEAQALRIERARFSPSKMGQHRKDK